MDRCRSDRHVGIGSATRGLDQAAALVVTVLFLLTCAPALALVLLRRAPITALVLGLAFPTLLAIVFIVAVIGFA
jgi:hypothetical protein